MPFSGKNILLGVTGSIAAYKTPLLVRLLKKIGAEVQVLSTPSAAHFVTPETLATVSGRPVLTEIFAGSDTWTQHVDLGRWADIFVIAPLSAQTLAKMAHGFADTMLTATLLASPCPVLACPAMDSDMYAHPAVKANLEKISRHGYHVMEAAYGEMASGLVGYGRMHEPEAILKEILTILDSAQPLKGKHALVTAGPTREPIDAVRVVSNYSTGTMGFSLAEALATLGATVTLVSGPTLLKTPLNVDRLDVETADEMYEAVHSHASADFVFMAAAVADYAPVNPSTSKLKKDYTERTIQLEPTRDILFGLGQKSAPVKFWSALPWKPTTDSTMPKESSYPKTWTGSC